MIAGQWQFWVDRGGTFTDVVARAPDGSLCVEKLLSENPEKYPDAAVAAIRKILQRPDGPLPPITLRIGTTVATNALLERKGADTCLVITRGFRDALQIGYQERPELFVRRILLHDPLYCQAVEIDERVAADGQVIRPLDEARARADLQAVHDLGIRSIAIILMHGYRYCEHEDKLAKIASEIGFTQISVSHKVTPLIKLVGRGDTTLVDAYLSPALHQYVETLISGIGNKSDILFMQSSGGLATGTSFNGKDAILSGPAGGIVGMVETTTQAGFDHVIGFDMGGTSTDVSHYAGQYERDNETIVAGSRIRVPMMRIHTVAAGGGSICRFDGERFQVGPRSAGALPGPACYRLGGPLTVTDCNVMLGKIQPSHFPRLFGPNCDAPLDVDCVREQFEALVSQVEAQTGKRLSAEQAAEGFIDIAVTNMANAIKKISVQRGHDVTRYTLACFGGAGGQHACLVADALAMDRVIIHPLAGVLSAYGMGLAHRQVMREQTLNLMLDEQHFGSLEVALDFLGAQAEAELREQGVTGDISRQAVVHVRYANTDNSITVQFGPITQMRQEFETHYVAQFGFVGEGELIAEMIGVEAVAYTDRPDIAFKPNAGHAPLLDPVACFMAGRRHDVPLYDRSALTAEFCAIGPVIIVDAVSTTVVEPGWKVDIDVNGNLVLTRHTQRENDRLLATVVDPVRLEIFNGIFMAIAEEMGAALQHSASSVNIRERLDFSCAVFDQDGNLVANAPHMPVHLGSMGESVRTIVNKRGQNRDGRGIRPGDAYALNAPYEGGTHLPDITVIMPVFVSPTDADPSYFVAARGHHADIGGITPGSMPPMSTSVEQEGVLLDNMLIVDEGIFLHAELAQCLASGRWPSRNVAQNIADLKAQIAACTKGASELKRISSAYGRSGILAYMGHVQANAEAAVRRLLAGLNSGHFRYVMDNEAVVEVTVTIDRTSGSATFDFSGSSAQLPGNFNAPLPVVRAAVLYALRTLIDDPIPMNEGCLRPITIIVPEGCMLNPRYPAAVVAGNVETSQVITDAIFGALGAMAAAQGTMNNFTFGNAQCQYYETIAGGSGAGPDFDGTDVVQTHMTNSRLTDPEILETRFPVMLEEFSIRRHSGGAGKYRGGCGATRRIRFLEAMEAGILSNRRRVPPFGLDGGLPGSLGVNRVERADGQIELLASTAAVAMKPGDVFVIETPGGGGYGKPG
ncbi:MAG: hydantoinase B/oxoprolinase family protein [Sphingorhabdus sp.]